MTSTCSRSFPNASSAGIVVNVSYTYDNLNRLSTVTDNRLGGSANTTTYSYDTANNVVTVTYPNTLQSTYQYDTLNRLTSMTASSNTAYGYTLGPTGIRTQALETSGRTVNWSFDGIYRLTGETVSGDQHYNGSVSYGLDPVGNRLSASSSLHGINSGSFNYNADDELSGELYDANGNVTASGGKTFAYDSQNRLTSMNGGAVRIVYDGDGNRVAKTANGVTTQYLVDDLNPTGYPQVVEEIVNGAPEREYTYGLQRIDEDQVIQGAWVPSFYGYDGFGTVRQLTNAAGAVTDTYEYDAFGNQITSTGTTPNEMLYRGEQYDSDLALYYLRARYYNPQSGRFMSRDPNAGMSVVPATLHKYLYASADPANRMDPSGRDALFETGVLLERDTIKVPYLNAMGCVAGIGFGAIAELKVWQDKVSWVSVIYGCATAAWSPAGFVKLAKTAVDVGTCAWAVEEAIRSYNEYQENMSSTSTEYFTNLFANSLGAISGCAATGLGIVVEGTGGE